MQVPVIDSWYERQDSPASCSWWKTLSFATVRPTFDAPPEKRTSTRYQVPVASAAAPVAFTVPAPFLSCSRPVGATATEARAALFVRAARNRSVVPAAGSEGSWTGADHTSVPVDVVSAA